MLDEFIFTIYLGLAVQVIHPGEIIAFTESLHFIWIFPQYIIWNIYLVIYECAIHRLTFFFYFIKSMYVFYKILIIK